MAALNTGAVIAVAATSPSITGTGIDGASPIASPGMARTSNPPVIASLGGSRSASEPNSAPPTTCGANPAPKARAAANEDRVSA
jgi:hypothetical protein